MLDLCFIDIIKRIADERGKDIFLDASKFKPLLLDYTKNDFVKETSLFLLILETDTVNKINIAENFSNCKKDLIASLEDNYNLSPQKCADMLDLLFHVLRGVIMQKTDSPRKNRNNSIEEEIISDHKKRKEPQPDPMTKKSKSDGSERIYHINNYGTLIIEGDKSRQKGHMNINENITDSIINSGNKNKNKKLNTPATVSEKQFVQILDVLEKFLVSKQAKNMKLNDKQEIQTTIDKVRLKGVKKGGLKELWKFIITMTTLTDFANNISVFLKAHPEIPETIRSIFMRLIP
jgi:hypothetical protein